MAQRLAIVNPSAPLVVDCLLIFGAPVTCRSSRPDDTVQCTVVIASHYPPDWSEMNSLCHSTILVCAALHSIFLPLFMLQRSYFSVQ